MVPILTNKDVFEPSYNDLKFTVQNHNYIAPTYLLYISVLVLSLPLVSGKSGLIKWDWNCSLLFNFLKEFKEHWHWFLFKCLVEFGACLVEFKCLVDWSHFSCVQLFATIWTMAHQAPLSMRFSRHEYWNGLLWPPPGNLPNPGIKLRSLSSPALAAGFFTTSTTWEAPGNALEWVTGPFSRGSSWPRDWTWAFCIAGRFFTIWATTEVVKPSYPELFFTRKFLVTDSIYILVVDLFRLSISS